MSGPTKKLRILVAEDEPTNATLVTRLLGRLGHEVVTVADGEAALAKATSEKFDLLLLDWMLPKLDGIEVTRRACAAGSTAAVIVMSVIEIPLAREHARNAGARVFLTKPLAPAELTKALTEAMAAPTPVKPSPRTPVEPNDRHPIVKTEGWGNLPDALGSSLSAMLSVPMTGRLATDADVITNLPGSECLLVDAVRGLEFRLGIFLEPEVATRVTSRMLEEPAPGAEEVASVITEISNVVAGAVKTCCQDGGALTMCLPVETTLHLAGDMSKDAVAVRQVILEAGDVRALARVAVRLIGARSVKVEDLREGLVLADDVRNDAGALVLPACTRLTAVLAERLQRNFRGRTVRVCEPERVGTAGTPAARTALAS